MSKKQHLNQTRWERCEAVVWAAEGKAEEAEEGGATAEIKTGVAIKATVLTVATDKEDMGAVTTADMAPVTITTEVVDMEVMVAMTIRTMATMVNTLTGIIK